jgi:predicted TIM-barrel fold metal-dependent hydrolase
MPYIDAHVHVWSDDFRRYPLAEGFKVEDVAPRSFTPEELFRHTKDAGVERINLIQIGFLGFDNRYMLEAIARQRDVFVGTAVIDPLQSHPDAQMLDFAKQGVRAFRIRPLLSKLPPARWLEPVGYRAMFQAGAKNNLAMSCLIDPDGLPELERMCKAYPETPVIVDHLCRIGASGTIVDREIDALGALAKYPRVLVKIGAFYALGAKKAPYLDLADLIEKVVKAFGVRRCMWESDCPYQLKDATYRDSLDLVRTRLRFLSADDRDWLLRRTAEGFFFPSK